MANELYHWGILGMKWGVRRYQNADGSLTKLGKLRYGSSENYETAKYNKQAKKEFKKEVADTKKNVKSLTDKELQKTKDRLQLEKDVLELNKKVKDLTEDGKTTKGQAFVEEVLTDSGKSIAKAGLTGAGKYGMKWFAKNVIGNEELGEALFNGGPKKK